MRKGGIHWRWKLHRPAGCLALALALVSVVPFVSPAYGEGRVKAAPTAKRSYTNGAGERTVVKVTRTRLAAEHRRVQDKTVRVEKGDSRFVHTVSKDGPIKDGFFTRTRRTVTVEAKRGAKGSWKNRPDQRPTRNALAYAPNKKLGPVYKNPKSPVEVRFYNSRVTRARLVIEGEKPIPMAHDGNRTWVGKTGKTIAQLDGKKYQFEVDLETAKEPLLRDPQSNAREIGFIQPDGQVHYFMPKAKKVTLVLHGKDKGGKATTRRIEMRPINKESWAARTGLDVEQLDGLDHHFEVEGKRITDPAAHGTTGDYGPARFVNLQYKWSDRSWMNRRKRDRNFVKKLIMRRGIMEVHPAGITEDPSAPVPANDRGTYVGLANPKVLKRLKQQFVGAVELMPVQQQDEFSAENGGRNYWGYMSTIFNSVARSYAKNPDKAHTELQAAVNEAHRNGLAVVMDVVYNHTANGPEHPFMLDKKAFYELTQNESHFMNGSGTGNVLNTYRRQVIDYVVHSVRHYAENYHVDGFRFDLMALLPAEAVKEIERRTADLGVFITGEPWDAAGSPKWFKGDDRLFKKQPHKVPGATRRQRSEFTERISAWNDDARHTIESLATRTARADSILTLLGGNMAPYGAMKRPSQGVNITSHDDAYIGDLAGGNRQIIAMANGVQILSRGIPSVAQFQDFGASKGGRRNIYNDPGKANWVDWKQVRQNRKLGHWTASMRRLRSKYPHFHIDAAFQPGQEDALSPTNGEEVDHQAAGVHYRPPPNTPGRKKQPEFLVLVNADGKPYTRANFRLPKGNWKKVADGETLDFDLNGKLGTARGSYEVASGTMVVLRKDP